MMAGKAKREVRFAEINNQLSTIKFFENYAAIIEVFKNGVHPECISIIYIRNNLRLMGIWPTVGFKKEKLYNLYNILIHVGMFSLILAIFCDLVHQGSTNFIIFADDLVNLLGLCLILFKTYFIRRNCYKIDNIIKRYNNLHTKYIQSRKDRCQIQQWQRSFFLGECLALYGYLAVASVFCFAILAQPLVAEQSLPFNSMYPFEWHNAQAHPIMHAIIYVMQAFCCIYNLVAIILIDEMGCHFISQTTVNLRILSWHLQELGIPGSSKNMHRQLKELISFHQEIINLAEDTMSVYYWNYVAQMGASTFIICFTAYETLLVQDQPMVAMKFLVYMISAFSQIFYWCFMGNKVFYDSLEVAKAAFNVHEWYIQSYEFKRDLKFVIQRAQKPIVFRSPPFPGFCFQTFTSILSTSYSYFALLRTMNEKP